MLGTLQAAYGYLDALIILARSAMIETGPSNPWIGLAHVIIRQQSSYAIMVGSVGVIIALLAWRL